MKQILSAMNKLIIIGDEETGDAMDILVKMDTVTRVQILVEAICISHCTNTLGKGMNLTSLQLWVI